MKNYLLILIFVIGTMINVQANSSDNLPKSSTKVELTSKKEIRKAIRKAKKEIRKAKRIAKRNERTTLSTIDSTVSPKESLLSKIEISTNAIIPFPSTDFGKPNSLFGFDKGAGFGINLELYMPLADYVGLQGEVAEIHFNGEHHAKPQNYHFSLYKYSLGIKINPWSDRRLSPSITMSLGQVQVKTQMTATDGTILASKGHGEGTGINGRKIEPTGDLKFNLDIKISEKVNLSVGGFKYFFLDRYDRLDAYKPISSKYADALSGITIGLKFKFFSKKKNQISKTIHSFPIIIEKNDFDSNQIEKEFILQDEELENEIKLNQEVQEESEQTQIKKVQKNKHETITIRNKETLHGVVAKRLGCDTSDSRVLELSNRIIEFNKEKIPTLLIDNISIIDGKVVKKPDGLKGDFILAGTVLKIPQLSL